VRRNCTFGFTLADNLTALFERVESGNIVKSVSKTSGSSVPLGSCFAFVDFGDIEAMLLLSTLKIKGKSTINHKSNAFIGQS
jgi:hypothetical protein